MTLSHVSFALRNGKINIAMNHYPHESYSNLTAEELVERLVNAGLDIPQGLPDEILARGTGVVNLLGRMMLDETLWKDERSQRG